MKKFSCTLLLLLSASIYAQSELVFVYFADKPNKSAFYANPLSELTQKSLSRRIAQGIPLNDQDAPVEPTYLQNIQNMGFQVADYSKWLNGVAVMANANQILQLQNQPFVQSVESFARNSNAIVKGPASQNKFPSTAKGPAVVFNYGTALAQTEQINLKSLHLAGYTGAGITIAVLDTGFPTVDIGSAYQRLWNNSQIKGGYNFISKNTDIYNTSFNPHGSYVLGAISGYIDQSFVGTAPDADLYLYATEDASVEIPQEEIYWIMAAEEADRKGVDVINSSLGYTTFDDSRYNYTYTDMNGTTSFIARGAQIAAEKGIFVVSAAGNSGALTWHYISTPADNQKVFTIGSVDSSGNPSDFSSYGPNSAGVVKPDASARGTTTATVFNNSSVSASGTSLASPLAAGGIACLLQATAPGTSREYLRSLLRQTASLFPGTNAQMGYGILNFGNALQQYLSTQSTTLVSFRMYPNPARDRVLFQTSENLEKIEIYDPAGRLIRRELPVDNTLDVSSLRPGIYYLNIKTAKSRYSEKLIKK